VAAAISCLHDECLGAQKWKAVIRCHERTSEVADATNSSNQSHRQRLEHLTKDSYPGALGQLIEA
jgi:hypothetical protein